MEKSYLIKIPSGILPEPGGPASNAADDNLLAHTPGASKQTPVRAGLP